jgi:serine protease Do
MNQINQIFSGTGPALDDELSGLAMLVRAYTVQVTARGRQAGNGSGIVWRHDGLIITNAHVARGNDLAVTFADGRTVEPRFVARDERHDLAALIVDTGDLLAAPIGDAADLRPGSVVLALGHPWGIANSLSLGVVHGVTRGRSGNPKWIAADVNLAPGNSGGPLVDATGRVVGVNAAIVNGLGAAIPSNVVERFVRQVEAQQGVRRPSAWAA